MRRVHWIIVGVLAVLGIGIGIWWWQSRPSPDSAVREALAAGQQGNLLRFERYVDIERFSEEAVRPLLSLRSDVVEDMLDWTAAMTEPGAEISQEELRSTLPDRLAEVMRQAVRDQHLHAALITDNREDFVLAGLLRASGVVPLQFDFDEVNIQDSTRVKGISRTTEESGRALVQLQIYNHPMDTTLALELRLEKQGEDWRVLQPENLRSLLEGARERQERLVARTDSVMQDSLAEMVEILGTPRRQIVRGCRYCSEHAEFTVRVANRASKPATYLGIRVTWPSVLEEDEHTITMMDTTSPGETITIVDTTYGSDEMLRLASVSDLEFVPEQIRLGEGRDDPAWFRVDDWDWYLNYWTRRQAGAHGSSADSVGTPE